MVPIHGFGEIDGRLYLDMRLIEGRNWARSSTDSDKPLDPALAVKIVEQVATALDAAHEAGLIHRDVKPSNILITDREFVYLIDFGLARTAGEAGLTTAGSTLGTMAYMAPERFEGGQVDPTLGHLRADVRALRMPDRGAAVSGRQPRAADRRAHDAPMPRPSAINPRLAAFDDVIAKGMAKKPAKRYQTAGELAAAARRALNAPVRTTGAAGGIRRDARPGGQAAGVAAGAGGGERGGAGGGAGTFGVLQWRAAPDEAMRGRRAWRRVVDGDAGGGAGCGGVDRGDGARRDQGDGPVGDRRECALCAKRIQGRQRVRSSGSTWT